MKWHQVCGLLQVMKPWQSPGLVGQFLGLEMRHGSDSTLSWSTPRGGGVQGGRKEEASTSLSKLIFKNSPKGLCTCCFPCLEVPVPDLWMSSFWVSFRCKLNFYLLRCTSVSPPSPHYSITASSLTFFTALITVWNGLVCMLCVLSHFSRVLTLCNPMDCSPPASSVHGISQARILEWVAVPSSRGSS